MRLLTAVALVAVLAAPAFSQTRKPPRRAPPPPVPPTKIAAEVMCPASLGVGVTTHIAFCDVMTGRAPASGIIITLPPHKGPATLAFDLHNRHTYSEEEVKSHRGFRRYTATISVVAMDGTPLGRAVVQNEFRTAADLVDRVGGGAGPSGVKAVAPTGRESIVITVPEGVNQVSVLGDKLTMERQEGTATYTQPDRPVADISNVMIEYRPARPPRNSKLKK